MQMLPVRGSGLHGRSEGLRRETSILLIEHDMDAVFRLADRISVLDRGRLIATGDAAAIRGNAEVQAVYLGMEALA